MTKEHADRPSKRGCLIPLLLIGIICALAIGGCVTLVHFGMSTLHESAEASLSENPVIQEHIGMIKELDPNLSDFDPDGKLNYMIEGTKGFGKVIFEADTSTDPPTIKSGIIEMSSGEVYELVPK